MLQYNQPITFGPGGAAQELNPVGISFDDNGPFSWTIAQVAELDVQLPIPRDSVALELTATPFTHEDRIKSQQVFIYLNGLFQGFCTLSQNETKSFPILRSAFSPRVSRLTFVLPTAASPKRMGIGEDMRELGMALTSLIFVI